MRKALRLTPAIALLLLQIANVSASERIVRAAELLWVDAPAPFPAGAKIAFLAGTPEANAPFTFRLDVPAGTTVPAHTHAADSHVTVLSGAMHVIRGAQEVEILRRGDLLFESARQSHELFFPEPSSLQITGVGQWKPIALADADGKKAAATLTVRRIEPAPGTPLGPGQKMTVVLDYAIDGFRPDTHWIAALAASNVKNRWIGGGATVVSRSEGALPLPPRPDYLKTAAGTYTLELDSDWLFRAPTEMSRPFRVRFVVHQATGAMTSRTIGETEVLEYAER